MKGGLGGASACTLSAKRRWRGLAVAVIGLVFLSMLVPLVFLLGLHNGFHSQGFALEQHNAVSADQSRQVDDLLKKLRPALSKDGMISLVNETDNAKTGQAAMSVTQHKGIPLPPSVVWKPLPIANNTRTLHAPEVSKYRKAVDDDRRKSCELKHGSYCLWRQEHKEEMQDSMIKKLKDQLFVARAYYPGIAKLPSQDKLSREIKQNIQDLEHIFSYSTTDSDLPPEMKKKSMKMEATIAKAKSFRLDCNNIDKKLRQIVDMTEDEANFHMRQSAFLFQLAVRTTPKSLHCLSMRLTQEFFESPTDLMFSEKHMNPELHHHVIFSNNVLASSVVINSTVTHSKESKNQVFHVLTNRQSYFAMTVWHLKSAYKDATVHVINIEDLNLSRHESPTPSFPKEFRVSFHGIRTEYLSVFSHSHYHLPEIFKDLKKIVVLGEDVVVQRDLSVLWELRMDGKVNGAVPFCAVKLESLVGRNGFNGSSCGWMSGLNVIDLVRWREQDVSNTYWRLAKEDEGELSEVGALRASLLAFEGRVHGLDSAWAVSGLGHDYHVDPEAIKGAVVLHYNGNMKPWLDLGIPKYRGYWRKFLNRENPLLKQCNVNP